MPRQSNGSEAPSVMVYSCRLPRGGPWDGLGGGEQSDQGHRRARRVLRERPQALQETVREGRAPVRVQEAPALREAQRAAKAEGARRAQEGEAARADVRLAAGPLLTRARPRPPMDGSQ